MSQTLPRVAERILDLVDRFGGLARPGARADLVNDIATLIGQDPAVLAYTPIYLIDPVSGLRFYPVGKSRVLWPDHAKTLPGPNWKNRRDPLGYVLQEYEPYIEAGLLYSGHLKQADRNLYNALWSQPELQANKRRVEDALRAHGILTSRDLADPAPGMEARIDLLKQIDLALGKQRLVQKYLLTARKRAAKRDAAALENRTPAI